MARLHLYSDNDADCTSISNRFIDEYMKDANDAQIKVYLYLTRKFYASMTASISDMADFFNYSEKDILRALTYWEKVGLLDMDYDSFGNLSGIRLIDLTNSKPIAKRSKELTLQAVPSQAPMDTMPAAPATPVFTKPYISLDRLDQANADPHFKQLVFVAEQYIGKPLTPSEIKSLIYYKDVLHFSDDLIDHLLQYCVDKGKKSFRYIDTVATSWAEEGISTPEEAAIASSEYNKDIYAVMKQLGKSSQPTQAEVAYVTRWTTEYGFSMDIIFEACARTVMATDTRRFQYAEGILKDWKQQNVHHRSDIDRLDEQHPKKTIPARQGNVAGTNKFNQFKQNDYDFAALEQMMLSN